MKHTTCVTSSANDVEDDSKTDEQQMISINDEPLRVPFNTNDFYNKHNWYNHELDYENNAASQQRNGAIEFIMTAEVCPKKTRAAALSQINEIDDQKILAKYRQAEQLKLFRSFTTVYEDNTRTQTLAQIENNTTEPNMNMFETHISKITEECDGDEKTCKDVCDKLKKNTAYAEDQQATSYLPSSINQKLRTKADVRDSNYHSDGEISSLSPHKSPRRMSSPEKLQFRKKLFALDDKVSKKVQNTLSKANQVRNDMQQAIQSANKVQEVYQEEQDNFSKAMEVQQEKLEQMAPPRNRFLDNNRYKRVGDKTDPKTLINPRYGRRQPIEEPKKDAHETCGVSLKHQRQHSTLIGSECLDSDANKVTNQRKSMNCRYSHVMPRVFTGRSQLSNMMITNSKETQNTNNDTVVRSVKHLTRLRSAHPNRKKSVPLMNETPTQSKKQSSTSLIKLQTMHKSLHTSHSNSGTPLASSDIEGVDQYQSTNRSNRSYKSANASFRHSKKSKIINYTTVQTTCNDYQPVMSCVPEIVNHKGSQSKSRSQQKTNNQTGGHSQTPLKSNSSNNYVRASRTNRNFVNQNKTQISSSANRKRKAYQNLNVPAIIRDENHNPITDDKTQAVCTPKNKQATFQTVFHHASKYETSKKSNATGYETVAFMDSTNHQSRRNRQSTPKNNFGSGSQAHNIRIKKFLTREQKRSLVEA